MTSRFTCLCGFATLLLGDRVMVHGAEIPVWTVFPMPVFAQSTLPLRLFLKEIFLSNVGPVVFLLFT